MSASWRAALNERAPLGKGRMKNPADTSLARALLLVAMVPPPHLSLAESSNNVFTTSCYQLLHRVRCEQSSEPAGAQ